MTQRYVLVVNLAMNMLNMLIRSSNIENCSADLGVPVYRLVDCLKFFIIFDRRSKRSVVGFISPMREVQLETTRKEDRSNNKTSSA